MTLLHIIIFSGIAVIVGLLSRNRWRDWLILTVSVVAIYWMQPSTPIRHLDFWLPTATNVAISSNGSAMSAIGISMRTAFLPHEVGAGADADAIWTT